MAQKVKNRTLKNIAALVFAVIFCIILLEVGLRIALPQNTKFTQFNPYVHHSLIPGVDTRHTNPQGIFVNEYTYDVSISKQGLREDKLYSKESDIFRIAVLGSSFTFGAGVESDETFSKVLERELGEGFEVINFGVPNYKPENQYLYLITGVSEYKPDLVIMNVPTPNIGKKGRLLRLEEGRLKYTPLEKPALRVRIQQSLIKYSHAWVFVGRVLETNRLTKGFLVRLGLFVDPTKTLFGIESEEVYEEAFALQSKIVLNTADYAKREGMGFVVSIIPIKEQIDKNKFEQIVQVLPLESFLTIEKPEEDLAEFLQNERINVVRHSIALKEKNLNNTFYFEVDGHFNVAGHELVGKVLYEYLAQKNLVE